AFAALVMAAKDASARKAPSVRTVVIDRYAVEPRRPGDGAPIVHVPDEVAEPLFLHVTKERFTVWWRARHTCDKALRPKPVLKGDRLTLVVEPKPRATPPASGCGHDATGFAATVFETTVTGWGQGPRELVSQGAPPGVA